MYIMPANHDTPHNTMQKNQGKDTCCNNLTYSNPTLRGGHRPPSSCIALTTNIPFRDANRLEQPQLRRKCSPHYCKSRVFLTLEQKKIVQQNCLNARKPK